ncbi:MAG TPA: serine/threonine-protein kinase, partial [Myxococcales bacterium]|nr:serine/threonine-protein kinase [Myxococcales bacterium]
MPTDIAESFAPGVVVGGCRIESFVAVGGFGVVYRARGPDGRTVAVKVAKLPTTSLSARELLLQQNEIEALIRLQHPSLVDVKSYGVLPDGRMYLVTEFVEGQVLKRYLADKGALDALEATRLVRRIAEALAYCHESNVLHLDLKPANIIIADPYEPRIKVLDFGLARITGGFRKRGSISRGGTLEYMAPECFAGTGGGDPYSARADLYALGVIFYEMLAGGLPFRPGLSLGALMEAKKAGRMLPLDSAAPQVPRPVVKLVHSLLSPEPAHRFSSAAALATRLKSLYYDALHGDPGGAAQDLSGLEDEPGAADAPFVGRFAELVAVRSAVGAVAGGKAGALAIVGEAGIGKSRLISEALSGTQGLSML